MKTSCPFGAFEHSAWTADERTATGYAVYLGGAKSVPATGFACVRCPATDATAIPFDERAATEIPDGVTDPGTGVRDAYAYRPPTKDSKPRHLEHHSGFSAISSFPWEPHESYAELIRKTASSGFKRTKLLNTEFLGVRVPSLFAVYVTPHYHGYHASTQSCHGGFGLFRASKDVAKSCFDAAYGGVVYGTCPDVPYVRCAKETPRGAASTDRKAPCTTTGWMPGFGPDGSYVPGVLLMNNDVGSEWFVRPGDVVHRKIVRTCDGKHLAEIKAPTVVNCCAAWNYAVFPHYGVVRSNHEPWSGDMPPTRDAVGDVACASREMFVEYHSSLGIVVAYRRDA
jgi:hypothetical protein